ncbi:Ig-like domain-containing protein [Paenibacillus puerhi]|uniref:Ig-like domain-containing protein n=1 Tax=Paenibacillus puerhi TaxID=2692622 RepID=UPI001357B4C9|nr:hypothetical protein [Paenibacillus puerhi]
MSNNRKQGVPLSSKAWRALLTASLVIAPIAYPVGPADASIIPQPVHDIVALPGEQMKLQLKDLFHGSGGAFQIEGTEDDEQVVTMNREDSTLQLFFLQPGQATFTVTLNGVSRQVAVKVLEGAAERPMDIGKLVRHFHTNPGLMTDRPSVSAYLQTLASAEARTNQAPTVSQATYALRYTSGYTLDVAPFFSDSDGDALEYLVLPAFMNGVHASISGSRLTLTGSQSARSAFTVYAADAKGAFASIKLLPNTAPTPVAVTASVYAAVYQQPQSMPLVTYFTDSENDKLSYRITGMTVTETTYSGPMQPLVPYLDDNDGVLRFSGQLAAKTAIQLVASDGQYESAPFSLTLDPSLSSSNRPPVGTSFSYKVNKHSSLMPVTLATYFDDPDGDPLTYTVSPASSGGVTASITNGMLSFFGQLTSHAAFTVTASDNHGATATAVFAYTVENQAPVGTSVTSVVYKNTELAPIALTSLVTDPDGDALTYTVSPGSMNGVTPGIADGMLTFAGSLTGPAEFTVRGSDDAGLYAESVLTLLIGNRPPIAAQEWVPLSVHNSVELIDLAANFSDPDLDELTFTVSPLTAGSLSASISGNHLSIAGIPTEVTSFTVTAMDSNQASVSAVYQLTPANTAPTAEAQTFVGARNTVPNAILLTDYFQDAEGDALDFALASSATSGGLTAVIEGSSLSFTGGQTEEAAFAITGTDLMGGSTTVTFTITLPNSAPVGAPFTIEAAKHSTLDSLTLSDYFSDPDGDVLTYELFPGETQPISGITAEVANGKLIFTGTLARSTEYTVRAYDTQGLYAEEIFSFIAINQAPVAAASLLEFEVHNQAPPMNLTDNFHDPDGDPLLFSVFPLYSGGLTASLDNDVLTLSGVPLEQATFTVTAQDDSGESTSASYVMVPVNNPPTAEHRSYTGQWNATPAPIQLTENFSDPDRDDELEFTLTSPFSGGLTASIEEGGMLTFSGQQTDTAWFEVTGTDPMGGTRTVTYTIELGNRPPVGESVTMAVGRNMGAASLNLEDMFTDPDEDELTYSVEPLDAGQVSAMISGTTLMFSGQVQSDASFLVTATELRNDGLSALSATAFVELQAINYAPIAADPLVTGYYQVDGAQEISFFSKPLSTLFADPNNDPLSFSLMENGEPADQAMANGLTGQLLDEGDGIRLNVTGMPESLDEVAEFTIAAADDLGEEALLVYQVKANHAPRFTGEYAQENMQPIHIALTGTIADLDLSTLVTDNDGDELSYELDLDLSDIAEFDSVEIVGHTLKFTGRLNTEEPYTSLSLRLRARDGKGGIFDFTLWGDIFYLPVALDSEVRVSYLKDQQAGEVARIQVSGNFLDHYSNELYLFVEDESPLPGYHAEFVYDDQGIHRYLILTKDADVTEEPSNIPVRVRAENRYGYAETTYLFQLNQGPVSLLPSSFELYPGIGNLDPQNLFADPEEDNFTVLSEVISSGGTWLNVTPDQPGQLGFDQEAADGTSGSVSFLATDIHGNSTSQLVQIAKPIQAPQKLLPDRSVGTLSKLTLKNLKNMYGLSEAYSFKAFSSHGEELFVSLSPDGQDMVLESGMYTGPYTITLIASTSDGESGFIDQFDVNVYQSGLDGPYFVYNPFYLSGETVDLEGIQSTNPDYAPTVSIEADDPDRFRIYFSMPDEPTPTTFLIRSIEGTIYEVVFDPDRNRN